MTFLAIMGGLFATLGFIPADGDAAAGKGPTCVMLGGSGLAVVLGVIAARAFA